MANAILTTKIDPTYDDLPDTRYHFPKNYLGRVEQTVGDSIVYYEPGRSGSTESDRRGSKTYFGIGTVAGIVPSPKQDGTYYALIEDFLPFENRVPFRIGSFFYESSLRKEDGSHNQGAFQNAVRIVPEDEFQAIVTAGYAQPLDFTQSSSAYGDNGFSEAPSVEKDAERPILERLQKRPFRDRVFADSVKRAYEKRCSLTGLQLINGGGRAEVEAAHIRPIGDGHKGPDSIWNGIALCQTAHWLFDRGLVSLEDDYSILVSPNAPTDIERLLRPEMIAKVPDEINLRPHSSFLRYHRDNIYKQ